jgi:hypothetical protein
VVSSKELTVIVIVLEPNLGKFTRVKRQVGRYPSTFAAENIGLVGSAMVAVDVLAAHSGDPSRFEAPEHL